MVVLSWDSESSSRMKALFLNESFRLRSVQSSIDITGKKALCQVFHRI